MIIAARHVDEERGVAAPRHPADDFDLAALEYVQLVRPPAQFIRGHACPSGSIGLPHHWHGGRPAATIDSVWLHNAAALPRVRKTRTWPRSSTASGSGSPSSSTGT